jgi:hypothetical protein
MLYAENGLWRLGMDNPYVPAVVATLPLAGYGATAGLTYASVQYLGGIGTTCIALCGTVGQQATRYAETLSKGVSNRTLVNIIKSTYQGSDKFPGGTFGALRNEIVTGATTGNRFHFQKTLDTLNGVKNVLSSPGVTKGDLQAIQTLVNNLSKEVAAAVQQAAKR